MIVLYYGPNTSFSSVHVVDTQDVFVEWVNERQREPRNMLLSYIIWISSSQIRVGNIFLVTSHQLLVMLFPSLSAY